jgi:ABC-type nitrate/sulfonate/bicarbonate transport system substrate-binding protein
LGRELNMKPTRFHTPHIHLLCLTLLAFLVTFFLVSCNPSTSTAVDSAEAGLIPMTFMPGYKPQADLPFVGAYVAQEKGFFTQEGLDVTITHSPGHGEHLQLLAAGEVQVTTQDAAVLLERRANPGLPLVSIALIGQRGQQAFASLASSGLQTPKDWEGHLVGYKGTPPPDLFALLKAVDADPDLVELVNVGFDPRVLTEGQVDVYPVYKSNEPFLIRSWGYDLILWDAADYGVPTLGLAYVTSDQILEENPDMLVRFLRAAIHGIQYASENIEEAVEIVMKYTGPETDPDHMRFMLESELEDLYSPATEGKGIGWQTLSQWEALSDLLVEAEAMPPVDANLVFTNDLLAQIYDINP